jgi:hypothetical protein
MRRRRWLRAVGFRRRRGPAMVDGSRGRILRHWWAKREVRHPPIAEGKQGFVVLTVRRGWRQWWLENRWGVVTVWSPAWTGGWGEGGGVSIELLARGKKGREGKGSRQRRPAPFKRSWWRGVKRKGPVSVHTRWRITRGVRRCDCGWGGGAWWSGTTPKPVEVHSGSDRLWSRGGRRLAGGPHGTVAVCSQTSSNRFIFFLNFDRSKRDLSGLEKIEIKYSFEWFE